jgi:hypothetical protein
MKKILIGIVGFILLVLVLIFLVLPRRTHIERSVTINAPREFVFDQANDLRIFHTWSPWTPLDPNATYEFSDPSVGVGATMSWKGNKDVGEGSMKITKNLEGEGIEVDLNFGPQGVATSAWVFEPLSANQTKATWTFDTDHGMNPMGRVFGYFFMDGMLGPDYETGLKNLKEHCESAPAEVRSSDETVFIRDQWEFPDIVPCQASPYFVSSCRW